jgi:hypothetical protein
MLSCIGQVVCLKLKAEGTELMRIFRYHNAIRYRSKTVDNKVFENMTKLKYLGIKV